jgi:hypothetical protein
MSVLSNARAICALEGLTLLTLLNSGPNLQPAHGCVQLPHPPAPHLRLAQASSNSGESYLQPPNWQAQPKPHESSGQRSSDDLWQTQEGGGVGRRQDPWGSCARWLSALFWTLPPGPAPGSTSLEGPRCKESARARARERETERERENERTRESERERGQLVLLLLLLPSSSTGASGYQSAGDRETEK